MSIIVVHCMSVRFLVCSHSDSHIYTIMQVRKISKVIETTFMLYTCDELKYEREASIETCD
jgi:hypothetical protein